MATLQSISSSVYPDYALHLASSMEGNGLVLDEYYTFEEYIHRRGTYLSRLPDYRHLPNACFIARRHAPEIFDTEEQTLNVEEVRKRELAKEFDPLLPLPTQTNTETLDNFKTCAPKGVIWTIDDGSQDEISQSARAPAGNQPQSTPDTSAVEGLPASASKKQPSLHVTSTQAPAIVSQDLPSIPDLSDLAVPSLDGNRLSIEPAIVKSISPKVPNQVAHQKALKPIENHVRFITDQIPGGTKVTEHLPSNTHFMNSATQATSQPPKVKTAIMTPALPKPQLDPTKHFTPDPRVSSMAHYGIVTAVKAPKRAVTPDAEAPTDDVPAPPSTVLQPPVAPQTMLKTCTDSHGPSKATKPQQPVEPAEKRQKTTRGVAQPVNKGPTEPVATRSARTSRTTASENKPETPPKTSIEAPMSKKQQHLEAIIAGTALPKTKAEAQAAATEHHARLSASQPKSRRSSARLATTADLMPFFFSPANFSTERDKDGDPVESVRCICGCVAADGGEKGGEMVQCDKCNVWQHNECVLPALSEEEIEGLSKFECTVCDPWARRDVLMALRAGGGKMKKGKERA